MRRGSSRSSRGFNPNESVIRDPYEISGLPRQAMDIERPRVVVPADGESIVTGQDDSVTSKGKTRTIRFVDDPPEEAPPYTDKGKGKAPVRDPPASPTYSDEGKGKAPVRAPPEESTGISYSDKGKGKAPVRDPPEPSAASTTSSTSSKGTGRHRKRKHHRGRKKHADPFDVRRLSRSPSVSSAEYSEAYRRTLKDLGYNQEGLSHSPPPSPSTPTPKSTPKKLLPTIEEQGNDARQYSPPYLIRGALFANTRRGYTGMEPKMRIDFYDPIKGKHDNFTSMEVEEVEASKFMTDFVVDKFGFRTLERIFSEAHQMREGQPGMYSARQEELLRKAYQRLRERQAHGPKTGRQCVVM